MRALTASGNGYEVTASWGSVEIPRRGDDPDEALELADVRMYAAKVARRSSITVTGPAAAGPGTMSPPAATA